MVTLTQGQKVNRDDILRSLVKIQYSRNDMGLERGTFRVRGDTVEILPAYEEQGVRVEMWGDEIEKISKIDPLTGDTIADLEKAANAAQQVNEQLIGGASTVVISTTTIIIILLVVIILVIALK